MLDTFTIDIGELAYPGRGLDSMGQPTIDSTPVAMTINSTPVAMR
jgi:hypothetical protein